MGRDVANDIEFIMGTSTLGAAFVGAMTAHNLQFRTSNTTGWSILASNSSLVSGTDGATANNLVTAGYISAGRGMFGSTSGSAILESTVPYSSISGSANIKTTGSSTTVVAVSGSAFDNITVGSRITANGQTVTVFAKASSTSITVSSAALS